MNNCDAIIKYLLHQLNYPLCLICSDTNQVLTFVFKKLLYFISFMSFLNTHELDCLQEGKIWARLLISKKKILVFSF